MRHSRIASRIQLSRSCRNARSYEWRFTRAWTFPSDVACIRRCNGGKTRSSRSDEIGRLSRLCQNAPQNARKHARTWWRRRRWKLFAAGYDAKILCGHPGFSGCRIPLYLCIVRISSSTTHSGILFAWTTLDLDVPREFRNGGGPGRPSLRY